MAEDRSARFSFGKRFDPLNVLVVRPVGYFVRAAAPSCAEVATLRGVSVDQVVVPLRKWEAAGGPLIGGVNNGLLARSAAIGL